MTAATWVLQRLPGAGARGAARRRWSRTLGQARDLVVEVHTRPSIILIRDGESGANQDRGDRRGVE